MFEAMTLSSLIVKNASKYEEMAGGTEAYFKALSGRLEGGPF